MDNTFFTADTHFCHANIIKYANRPFDSIDDMNMALINNWNEVVRPHDTVYHLGDFGFFNDKSKHRIIDFLNELNGYIVFLEGNHDKKTREYKERFNEYYYMNRGFVGKEISVNGQEILLTHYAMRVWNKSHHGVWCLYGHSHNTLPDDPEALSIDVGVDCHNYRPISFDEVKVIMSKKNWKPVDHHGAE